MAVIERICKKRTNLMTFVIEFEGEISRGKEWKLIQLKENAKVRGGEKWFHFISKESLCGRSEWNVLG